MKPEEILNYMPDEMKRAFLKAEIDWDSIEEIRIRTRRPILISINNIEYVLSKEGGIFLSAGGIERKKGYIVWEKDITEIIEKLCGYSVYAYEEELRQGYFTLEGGHRVGLAGKTVVERGTVKTLKDIRFLNIRIAHEKRNCGKKVITKLVEDGKLKHSIIISPPACGKSTLLRDMIRLLSDGFYYEEKGERKYFNGITVGGVDERSEIGASVKGVPTMDLGIRTDLMDGCPKHIGIFMLLRSMAPKVIAVDEIGDEKDFEAIRQAVNSGCTILATAHGASYQEMERKRVFASFLKEQIFERCIILSDRNGKGTVERIEVVG
jgi:stage III sporulation protein AA